MLQKLILPRMLSLVYPRFDPWRCDLFLSSTFHLFLKDFLAQDVGYLLNRKKTNPALSSSVPACPLKMCSVVGWDPKET